VRSPKAFLREIRRFTKPGGRLILEDGHQPREVAREKVRSSGIWWIEAETRWHLRCAPAVAGEGGR
jgi:ubiquinone/menaquinone biosynthesis C-methylase UbiE